MLIGDDCHLRVSMKKPCVTTREQGVSPYVNEQMSVPSKLQLRFMSGRITTSHAQA